FHFHCAWLDLYLDSLREHDGLVSYTRHLASPRGRISEPPRLLLFTGPRCLPDLAENLAAHTLPVSGAAGHNAPRRSQDVDPHAAQHARNLFIADVDPAPRPGNPLDPRYHRRIIGAVLQ